MNSGRLDRIQQHLYTHGSCEIQELVAVTGASTATVRRDLHLLEQQGLVNRTHGGAMLAASAGPEVAFQMREQEHLPAKRAIADAAYRLLKPHSTIFLDAGTTVLQLARRLRLGTLPVTVFTNGLAVAQELVNVDGVQINLLGGQLRNENLSFVGPHAESVLQELWFDQLFVGTSAVHRDGSLYTLNIAEARLGRAMLTRTSQAILLTDSGKFGTHAPYLVAPITACQRLITDHNLDAGWQARLAELGVASTLVNVERPA